MPAIALATLEHPTEDERRLAGAPKQINVIGGLGCSWRFREPDAGGDLLRRLQPLEQCVDVGRRATLHQGGDLLIETGADGGVIHRRGQDRCRGRLLAGSDRTPEESCRSREKHEER